MREVVRSDEMTQGCQIWHPNWVRLAPNGTNLELFKIIFSTFDVKKALICPIEGQSDPIWMLKLRSLVWRFAFLHQTVVLLNTRGLSELISHRETNRSRLWMIFSPLSEISYLYTICLYIKVRDKLQGRLSTKWKCLNQNLIDELCSIW